MKPKNIFQQQVLEASKKLPSISEAQVKWAYKNCLEHLGRRLKNGTIACLECGHSWVNQTTDKHCSCPNCSTKLSISDTKKRVFGDYQYLCIITTCEGFQVLRFFYVESISKVGKQAQYFHSEVVQRWIAPSGKYTTMAKLRPMSYWAHTWLFGSELEIRPEKPLYNIIPTCTYPRQRLLPELKRSGYSGQFHGLTPFDMFQFLLSENKAETLLKARQVKLFRFFAHNPYRQIGNYWASIRIGIRNGYTPTDATMWCDYIDLLRFFGKDLHNAKYVCPTSLQAEHDRYVSRKTEWSEQQRRDKAKRKALEDEARFQELKSSFFGIQFTDGLIQIRVLESIKEFVEEGEAMHHCLYANSYHLKPDSLILSACINDQRLETVEFSLSRLQVLQCRGVCNKVTQYHKRILQLVEKNVPLIQKRLTA